MKSANQKPHEKRQETQRGEDREDIIQIQAGNSIGPTTAKQSCGNNKLHV